MKKIAFTKMHGTGNDFVVIEQTVLSDLGIELEVQQIVRICDRHFGVGSDGILVVGKSKLAGVDYDYRMYNPDGSEAEMCGNGIRCYMKYLRDNKLTTKKRIKVQTGKGVLTIEMMDSGMICVDMGTPILDPMSIGFIGEQNIVKAHERLFTFTPVSMGNPHAVVYLKRGELEDFDIARYGSAIENMREMFKNRTNVEFLEILSETEINMRVWERGAGETLACGTGACGAVVAGILDGYLRPGVDVQVNLEGGTLYVNWSGKKKDSVILTGPAENVFEGNYFLAE